MKHPRSLRSKKSDQSFDTLLLVRMPRNIRCRLNAQNRYASCGKMLEQITVIARNFYHEAIFVEPKSVDHHPRVASSVFDPSARNTAKVGIITEYRLRGFEFLKLRQEAFFTHPYLERIGLLTLGQIFRLRIGVRHRRHPQITHQMIQRLFTIPACCGFCHKF